jgi:hypothetical protein
MWKKLDKSELELWHHYIEQVQPIAHTRIIPNRNNTLMSRGRWRPFLDLHGRSIQDAYASCIDHFEYARQNGVSRVTVVTGRGGLIAREFPEWLKNWGLYRKAKSKNGGGCWIIVVD